MGRHCGFYFYRLINDKLVKVNVVDNPWLDGELSSWLQIDGRCGATTIFLDAVKIKEVREAHSFFSEKREMDPEHKYNSYLLLNHPELDNFKQYWEKGEYFDPNYEGWFDKYFYIGLENFRELFDFDEAQKTHNQWIREYKDNIKETKKEIKSLRTYQTKAETKAAFDGFEEKIGELKEKILSLKESIVDLIEDDYDYDHYMCIKYYLEKVEKVINDNPDVIVAAFAND